MAETDNAPPAPRKLPGRMRYLRLSAGAASASALWLGPHSVILSQLHFYRESYRQFDFASIQGLVLRETSRGMVYNIIGAALAACFGAVALTNDEFFAHWFDGGIAGFWLLLILVNVIRGSTCRVELQTAVGRRELVTLNRTRIARRALQEIVASVERVQGALPAAEAEEKMNAFLASHSAA